jgi:uncharacterized protein YndB with AHSA1/START domain
MVLPASTQNVQTLTINEEIRVKAPIEVTFAALLEELGPLHQVADDRPLPMKLEARPGGRWYRDLGQENGHLWGYVQAIKRPMLLEISGPLMISYASVSNLQYRLTLEDGGTLITFRHTAVGLIPEDNSGGFPKGWAYSHERIRRAAEKAARV